MPLVQGPTSDSVECIDAHRAAALDDLPGLVFLGLLRCARAHASTAAGSSAPLSGSGSGVEVIVGPTLPSTTDSRTPQIPLSTGDPETFSTFWTRLSAGRSRARAAEVSRARPLSATSSTTAGPQPDCRRQPDSQPAFGPRSGCQPASRTAAKALCLTVPTEGQTLGYRVADVPNQCAGEFQPGCGGLDSLDQRWGDQVPSLRGFRDGRQRDLLNHRPAAASPRPTHPAAIAKRERASARAAARRAGPS